MNKAIEFSPMIVVKEKDGTISTAVVVDNGPCLMYNSKEYTETFNKLIECFPKILTATFYNKAYTSYKIKVEGEDDRSIIGIKKFLDTYEEKKDEDLRD